MFDVMADDQEDDEEKAGVTGDAIEEKIEVHTPETIDPVTTGRMMMMMELIEISATFAQNRSCDGMPVTHLISR